MYTLFLYFYHLNPLGMERHDCMNILAIGDVVGAGGCAFLRA